MNSPAYLIRPARTTEAKAVHAILWAARDVIGLKERFNSDAYVGWTRTECAEGRFWIADVEGDIAGVMNLTAASPLARPESEIFYLVTVPAYEHQGIATAMIAHAKQGRPALHARAKVSNDKIIKPLHASGFTHVGIIGDWLNFEWKRA